MPSKKILLFLFLLISTLINAQDNEIEVKGYSYTTLLPKEVSLKISISDVAPNEFKKTRFKKLEQVYSEFIEKLAQNGFQVNLKKDEKYYSSNSYNSNSVNFENYTLNLKNEGEANALKKLVVEGVQIRDIKYIYGNLQDKTKNEMVENALENAKQNATYLVKKINRKLGPIKSISSSPSEFIVEKEREERQLILIQYITIIFELL